MIIYNKYNINEIKNNMKKSYYFQMQTMIIKRKMFKIRIDILEAEI